MTANPISPLTPAAPVPINSGSIARLTPLDPIRVLRQHFRLLVAVLFVGVLAGVALAYLLERVAPEWTSEAYVEVSGGPIGPFDDLTAPGGIGKYRLEVLAAFIRNQIVRIKSDAVMNSTLKREKVQQTKWYASFSNDTTRREALQERLEVNRVIGSTVIRIAMTDGNTEGLQTIIDELVDVYLKDYKAYIEASTSGVRQTFMDESRRADTELQQAQRRLDQFLELNDLPTLETHNNEAVIEYQDLARQVATVAVQMQTGRNAYNAMMEKLNSGNWEPDPQDMVAIDLEPGVAGRKERLRSLREQYDVALARFGAEHRVVRDLGKQIEAVDAELNTLLERLSRERLAQLVDRATKVMQITESQFNSLAPKLRESRNKVRDIVLKLERYRRLKGEAEAAAAKGNRADDWLYSGQIMRDRPDSAGVRELSAASAPDLTFPHFGGIILGTAFCFELLAISLVFVKELLDQRIKSPSDVKLIPRVNILGMLPEADEDPLGPAQIENIVHRDPTGLLAESFRQARTGLLTQMHRGGLKTIMVVGAQPECGVSSVINNMAISLSLDGRKVLVIDANFRRPMQHVLFNTRTEPGLVEVLRGTSTFESAVVRLTEPNLDVMSAGNGLSVSPELLEGAAFQQLLNNASGKYDVILIDAPPALLTSESQMLARQVHGVICVVSASRDKRGMVGRMLRELEAADANILGVLLNGVQASAGGYFRKNYDEFYKYRQGLAAAQANEEQSREYNAPAATVAANQATTVVDEHIASQVRIIEKDDESKPSPDEGQHDDEGPKDKVD